MLALSMHWQLVLIFFVVAAIYASVGFGGGSSYLAVLALYHLPVTDLRLTALLCNIVVVAGGTLHFARSGHLNVKKLLPIVLCSIPLSYLGALVPLTDETFFVLLGVALMLAAILLFIQRYSSETAFWHPNPATNAGLGGAVGFLSGMVSIGGGIFLSPLLHLCKWDTAKRIAATASLFILVNSVAGLLALLPKYRAVAAPQQLVVLVIAVLAGGQVGSRLGVSVIPEHSVRLLTGLLVFVAGFQILSKHLHLQLW
jgi:uncharacterized protein